MMDFGYLGSSSNLSPLAPPFTLDRSFPKPNNENFTDPPPAMPYSSPLPNWQYSPSSASNPNLYPNASVDLGVDSTQTTYLASESYYPYFGASSISSPSIQKPPLKASFSTTPDAYAFSQYSSKISASHVEDDVPLVALNKPNYDLLSNPRNNTMDGPSQVDYHQSLSDLNYKPQWGSYWDNNDRGADGGERRKKAEYDSAFCSTQTDSACSYMFQSYSKPAASIAENINMGKQSSTDPHLTCLNLLGGETQIATPITREIDYKPFSTQGSSFTAYAFPKSHANVPPVEAITAFSHNQKPYTSQDQSFQPFNVGKIGPVTIKRPSSLIIRAPSVGSKDKKDHVSDSTSSNIKRELPNKTLDEKIEGHLIKENTLPYSFTSASDRAKSVTAAEGSLESLDRNYPALDSPCWKGSSSFNFSASENNGVVTSDNLAKKPESLGSLKLQQNLFFTPFEVSTENAGLKVHENRAYQENGYVELGSLLYPVKVDSSTHGDKLDNAEMSSNRVDSFSNSMDKLTKELGIPSDLKSSDSEKDLELGFGVAKAGLNCSNISLRLNVLKLVDTIHNLSEMLLSQYSKDTSVLSDVSHETLKLAVKNLDACVSKKAPYLTQESNSQKSYISGDLQVTKKASSHLPFDNHSSHQGLKSSKLSEEEVKKFTDLFYARVNEDFEKDDKVTRGIKKVLEENFNADDEKQSEAFLYKHLWLEAEAALCSSTFRARYDRMRTEMDKYKSPKTIDEPAKTFEELYSEVFPDPRSPGKGNPIIEAFKMLHKSTQDPSASKVNESIAEVDESIKARLDILNNRVQGRNSVSEGDHTDEEADAAFAETIKTVEKLLSSEDADECSPEGPTHAIGKVDNVEARVMTRFQLLKNREFNKISEQFRQPLEQAASCEFSEETNPWRFSGILYDDNIVDGPLSQIRKLSEHKQDYPCGTEGVKDFSCATDLQLSGNERMVTQLSSGWCDGSLLDWEDVLKDDHCH